MLTLLRHLGERQIEGSKGEKRKKNKKEGKDQGNMGEGEGKSRSEGACVKVAVREGASLIPRASYQTVSRLQQLLSAQNTQALPFQLKGSLTKSEEEKKIPCRRRAGLPPAQGALRRALHRPEPRRAPAPGALAAGGAKRLLRSEVAAGCERFPVRRWGLWVVLGCSRRAQLSLRAQVMGLWARGIGVGGKGPQGGWRWPRGGAASPAGSIWLQGPTELLPGPTVDGQTDTLASLRSPGDAHALAKQRGCEPQSSAPSPCLGTPMPAALAAFYPPRG